MKNQTLFEVSIQSIWYGQVSMITNLCFRLGAISLVMLLCVGISTAAEPSFMPLTISPPSSDNHDDEAFIGLTDPVINALTKTRLNSTERIDLQSVYYSAVQMKVSPELYPMAVNVTRLLFYITSSSEAYEEYERSSGLGSYNREMKNSLMEQGRADADVAEAAWKGLAGFYPNVTLFR